jgi:hypothetical protein
MLGACNKAPPARDPARDLANARRNADAIHRTLAALPPTCIVGTGAQAPAGSWQTAPKAFPEAGRPYTFIQQFDSAMTTGTVRAGLNRAALRALDKVETRDTQGIWHEAGPVTVHEAPRGCDYVWLQQDLGSERQVEALRYTFRRSDDLVSISDVGALTSH